MIQSAFHENQFVFPFSIISYPTSVRYFQFFFVSHLMVSLWFVYVFTPSSLLVYFLLLSSFFSFVFSSDSSVFLSFYWLFMPFSLFFLASCVCLSSYPTFCSFLSSLLLLCSRQLWLTTLTSVARLCDLCRNNQIFFLPKSALDEFHDFTIYQIFEILFFIEMFVILSKFHWNFWHVFKILSKFRTNSGISHY